MWRDAYGDEQVTGGTATGAGVSLSCESNGLAIFDAGGDFDGDVFGLAAGLER
ncbi:MAG: hypothetical protein RL215_695 [Planctomycetota bacterium]